MVAAGLVAVRDLAGPETVPNASGGRPALLVGQTEDWLREEFLLDAETYTYLGQSGTVVRDAIIDPAKAGNDTGEVDRGHKVVAERLTTAIVDHPGQRR